EDGRDLASLVVPRVGSLVETGDVWEPWRLLDPAGEVVGPVAVWLRDLQAAGRSALTQRSYGMDLLRWDRPVGDGGALEPGHPSRGARVLPVDSGHRQAQAPWSWRGYAEPGDGQAQAGRQVRDEHARP